MAVFPQEFFDHMRASFRGQLLAWRSLLDNWVEAVEEREVKARTRTQQVEGPNQGAGARTSLEATDGR